MKSKKCLVCDKFFVGRIDKKYCSDQCRNVYNNKINSNLLKEIRKTNKRLRVNREILKKYNQLGVKNVSLFSLISDGFVLTYFTNMYKDSSGNEVYFCYDLGYQFAENETLRIFEKKVFERQLVRTLD
ncbi:MAG: hypothetical protein R2799_07320 [Crocinitomicaceae bacterium]